MALTSPSPQEIQALIQTDTTIPCGAVEQWMESEDLDVLGAVYDLLTTKRAYSRIQPPFRFDGFPAFMLRYMERCFREAPDSDWAHNWSVAGMELVNYYHHLWDQKQIREQEFTTLKQWLDRLYRGGDTDIRYRVETAILEHLFEVAEIADYFSDWQHDPILQPAYSLAMEWARDHPRKRRRRT